MKFLITAGADPAKAAPPDGGKPDDAPFDEQLFVRYMQFNEALQKAGVLIASEGLNPGKDGARVGVKDGKRVLLDGPYAESKELVGGFYLIDVKDRAEAIEWALRCPTGMGSDDLLAVHPLTAAEDLPPELVALAAQAAPQWFRTFADKQQQKGGAR